MAKGMRSKYIGQLNQGMVQSQCFFSPEENEMIRRAARDARMSKQEFLRWVALNYVRERFQDDPAWKNFTPPGLR